MTDDVVSEQTSAEAPPAEAGAAVEAPAASAATPQMSVLDLLGDVQVAAAVELGSAHVRLGDLAAIRPGTVIELDRMVGDHADLLANGRLIARGEVVVVDGAFALRVTDIVSGEQ